MAFQHVQARQKITPFLWFEDKAEEGMNFYVSLFTNSGSVSIQKCPEGVAEGPMAGFSGKVLAGVFELAGEEFIALDGRPNVFPAQEPFPFS